MPSDPLLNFSPPQILYDILLLAVSCVPEQRTAFKFITLYTRNNCSYKIAYSLVSETVLELLNIPL